MADQIRKPSVDGRRAGHLPSPRQISHGNTATARAYSLLSAVADSNFRRHGRRHGTSANERGLAVKAGRGERGIVRPHEPTWPPKPGRRRKRGKAGGSGMRGWNARPDAVKLYWPKGMYPC